MIAKQEHFALISEEILKKGNNLRFQATGFSMHPFIKNGQTITITPVKASELKVGDIAFFKRAKNCFVAHRVIAKHDDNSLITKGDACNQPDGQIKAEQILGKVVAVQKKSRQIKLDSWTGKLLYFLAYLQTHRTYQATRKFFVVLLKPILYKLQNSKKYRLLAKKFRGHIELGPAKPKDDFMLAGIYGYWQNSPVDIQEATKQLQININEHCFRLIARKKGHLVGTITLKKDQHIKLPESWSLWGLVVRPRYRGLGIGKQLTEFALTEIAKKDGQNAVLFVEKQAKPAIALYEDLGFTKLSQDLLSENYKQKTKAEIAMRLQLLS